MVEVDERLLEATAGRGVARCSHALSRTRSGGGGSGQHSRAARGGKAGLGGAQRPTFPVPNPPRVSGSLCTCLEALTGVHQT